MVNKEDLDGVKLLQSFDGHTQRTSVQVLEVTSKHETCFDKVKTKQKDQG